MGAASYVSGGSAAANVQVISRKFIHFAKIGGEQDAPGVNGGGGPLTSRAVTHS
jgi:hypothetical protein